MGQLAKLDAQVISKIKSKIGLLKKGTLNGVKPVGEEFALRNAGYDYRLILFRYRPREYLRNLIYIRNEFAHTRNPKVGWEKMVQGNFEMHIVPGNHLTRLTKYGKITAEKIVECL